MSRPLGESELIERARRGDHDAYRELARAHEGLAFRVAYTVVRSAADAEDVVQEAFVKAYRSLGRFRAGEPFRPWLLRIVGNEARNRRRAMIRRERLAARAAVAAVSGGAAPSPETRLLEGEDRARLLAAVDRLSPEHRLAIVGRYFLGLTDEEAAALLGVRRGAVKTRVFRALAQLRADLEGDAA